MGSKFFEELICSIHFFANIYQDSIYPNPVFSFFCHVANLRSFKILIGESKPRSYGYLAVNASQRMPALLMPGRKKAGGRYNALRLIPAAIFAAGMKKDPVTAESGVESLC